MNVSLKEDGGPKNPALPCIQPSAAVGAAAVRCLACFAGPDADLRASAQVSCSNKNTTKTMAPIQGSLQIVRIAPAVGSRPAWPRAFLRIICKLADRERRRVFCQIKSPVLRLHLSYHTLKL